MKYKQFTTFLAIAAISTPLLNNAAQATEPAETLISPVAMRLNIAKKEVLGHLAADKKTKAIMLDGARVEAPKYKDISDRKTKIWFTTEDGSQHKWPFIELYQNGAAVASVEPAAGGYAIKKSNDIYNHYSGVSHREFATALPSTFQKKNITPLYPAFKSLENSAAKRPMPRKISFIR